MFLERLPLNLTQCAPCFAVGDRRLMAEFGFLEDAVPAKMSRDTRSVSDRQPSMNVA
jgi:hypothetical protein